jgi:hypothetical protein
MIFARDYKTTYDLMNDLLIMLEAWGGVGRGGGGGGVSFLQKRI